MTVFWRLELFLYLFYIYIFILCIFFRGNLQNRLELYQYSLSWLYYIIYLSLFIALLTFFFFPFLIIIFTLTHARVEFLCTPVMLQMCVNFLFLPFHQPCDPHLKNEATLQNTVILTAFMNFIILESISCDFLFLY